MKIEFGTKKKEEEEFKDHTEVFYLDPIAPAAGGAYHRIGIQMRR